MFYVGYPKIAYLAWRQRVLPPWQVLPILALPLHLRNPRYFPHGTVWNFIMCNVYFPREFFRLNRKKTQHLIIWSFPLFQVSDFLTFRPTGGGQPGKENKMEGTPKFVFVDHKQVKVSNSMVGLGIVQTFFLFMCVFCVSGGGGWAIFRVRFLIRRLWFWLCECYVYLIVSETIIWLCRCSKKLLVLHLNEVLHLNLYWQMYIQSTE